MRLYNFTLTIILTPPMALLLSLHFENLFYARAYIYDDDVFTVWEKLKYSLLFVYLDAYDV